MSIALSVKNKLGFVDGTIVKPADTEASLLISWTRSNNIVISWILNAVSKDISASILFSDSAAAIWEDLKERFQQSNGPRIFQLRRDLLNLRQEQDSVSVYFTKLKAIWEELNNFRPMCSCGRCNCEGVKKIDTYFQTDYIMTFLMGLNDSFAQVRTQVLLDPIPTINRVFSLVVQEERQRTIGIQAPGMALAIKGDQVPTQPKGRGSLRSHRERPFCTKCNVNGHTLDTCYKIHGYPPGFKQRGNSSTRPHMVNTNQVSGNSTILDHPGSDNGSSPNIFQSFNKDQMDQLKFFFNQHLSSLENQSHSNNSSSGALIQGGNDEEDDWQG